MCKQTYFSMEVDICICASMPVLYKNMIRMMLIADEILFIRYDQAIAQPTMSQFMCWCRKQEAVNLVKASEINVEINILLVQRIVVFDS